MKNDTADRPLLIAAILLGALIVAGTLIGAAALGAQAAPERGAFLIVQRNDTLVIERFTRSADSITGTITTKGQPRIEYATALGTGNTVRTMTLDAYRAGGAPGEASMQHVLVTMRGDSAIAEIAGRIQAFATKAGAIPGVNNTFAMFELFVRRERAAGAAVEVPYFALSGGVTLPVSVKPLGADSVVATIAGMEQRLRVDAEGRILGGVIPAQNLEIKRVSANAAAGATVARPDYSAPAGAPYVAEEVQLTGQNGIPLGGTLTLPKNASGRVPAIVTITGSGQQDRDEFIPVAGGYRPFRQVADTLGRRGIAVLRLDDRMVGASGGQIGTSADYADDIRAALAYLRTRPEIDPSRLGLLGHSEGGLIGPMVAANEPTLKALVILAGPAYTGLDIIHYQQKYAIDRDTALAPAKRDSAYRASARAVDSAATSSVWTKFFLAYDPIPTARNVKTPTLILQGGSDRQVTPEQAEKLAAAIRSGGNKDVTVRVFPEMNHLFIHDADGSPSGYARLPTNRMSSDVLGTIADWLAAKLEAGGAR